MTPAESHAALSEALGKLISAHDALVANVNPATLSAFERAIEEARLAHRALETRAVERFQNGKGRGRVNGL